MNDKAGTMGSGAMWGFVIGSSVLGGVLSFVLSSTGLTWLLSLVILIAGGWAAVFFTKASAGKGIVAFLAGGVVAAIVAYIGWKSMVAGAMSQASGELTKSMGDLAKSANGANAAQVDAQMAQASAAISGGLGAMVGIMVGVVTLIRTFLLGMIGCFIGNSMKKSATGGAVAKAA
jgi:hypothetical protein